MKSSKIKILLIIHGLNTGGAETLVKEYALKIDKQKFDISILCWDLYNSPYEELLKKNEIPVVYVGKKNNTVFWKLLNRFLLPLRIKKTIHNMEPDIIHSHLPINNYVKFAHPKIGTKIFHTVHSEPNAYWGHGKNKKDLKAAKWLVKNYGMQFIALHEKMKDEINDLFNVRNTVVINNGIDFTRFESAKEKLEVRKELEIPEDAFVIGHIGRFLDVKNHEFIVEVFKEVYLKKENAFLLLVGDGILKEKIQTKLEDAGVKGHYLIISNRNDIPDILNAMDVFIFPSKYEGLGIVLIEAQKMRLPSIVSDTVPKYAQVSNLIRWHSLNEPIESWVNSVCNFSIQRVVYNHIEDWNMSQIIKKLEKLYEK